MARDSNKSLEAELLHLIQETELELALNNLNFCSPLATPVDGLSGQHGGNVVAFPVKSKPDHSELIVFLGVNERQRDPDISALVVKELSGDVDSL